MSLKRKCKSVLPPLSMITGMLVIVITIVVAGKLVRSTDKSIMLPSTFNLIVTVMSGVNIIDKPIDVGTRVHWDATKQALYYVDVPNSLVFKHQPSTNRTTTAKVGTDPIGFAFPVAGNSNEFIASLGRKFVIFSWDGESENVTIVKEIGEVDADKPTNRLNGGKVDPKGRLWAGTMGKTDNDGNTPPGLGSLFSIDRGVIKKRETNIGISNGLAWNMERKKMYYIDTMFLGVYQYDYDPDTGDISNRSVLYQFSDDGIDGSPDGLTIDTDGNLWVAVIWGSKIIQISPEGKLLKKLEMPTPEITAVTFGGKNMDILYVNSAKMPINGKIPDHPAGCTFAIKNLGVKGLPGDNYIK